MTGNNRKRLTALLVTAAFIGVVAGCGGSTASTAPSAAATQSQAPTTTVSMAPSETAPAATGKLEVYSWWTSGGEAAALQVLMDAYSAAYPGVELVNGAVSGGGGANMQQVLQTRIAGSTPPDTWQSNAGSQLANYAAAGTVADLSSLYASEGWTDVVPSGLTDGITIDGKQYAVFTGSHRHNVVWVNKPVAAQLGLTFPESGVTLAQFQDGMAKAKAAGLSGMCTGDQSIFADVSEFETVLASYVGADGLKKLATEASAWDDPKVISALANYGVILDNTNADHNALSWDQAVGKFLNGECLFNMMADSMQGEVVKAGKSADVGFYAYPGTDDLFLNVSDAFVVSGLLADSTNALNWAKLVMDPKVQVEFSVKKGSIPLRSDIDMTPLSDYQKASANCLLRSCTNFFSITFGQTGSPAVNQALYDAITAWNTSRDGAAFVTTVKSGFSQ